MAKGYYFYSDFYYILKKINESEELNYGSGYD